MYQPGFYSPETQVATSKKQLTIVNVINLVFLSDLSQNNHRIIIIPGQEISANPL